MIKVTTVATINNTPIVVIENGEKRVAIKPICEALGIAFEPQFTRLKSDPILSSVVTLSVTTGADGKRYEMVTIPFRYVFGWLFRIDSRNVKEESRASVLNYQIQCYDALYNHFKSYMDYTEYRLAKIADADILLSTYRAEFNLAKDKMKEAQLLKNEAWAYTFEDYIRDKSQLKMEFPETVQEGGQQ